MHAISLTEKFSLFEDQWTPKIIAQLNGQDVKLAKIQGNSSGMPTMNRTSCSTSSRGG